MISPRRLLSAVCSLLILALPSVLAAAELEAVMPYKPIAIGETIELKLELKGAHITGEPEFLDLPNAIELNQPTELQRLQNARQRIYLVTFNEPGSWSLGEIVVPTDQEDLRVSPLPVSVSDEPRGAPVSIGKDEAHLSLATERQELYLGQVGHAKATLYLPRNTRIDAALSPLTLDRQGLIASPAIRFEPTGERMIGPTVFNTWTFPVRFTAIEIGPAVLGPAQVQLQLVQTTFEGPSFAPGTEYTPYRIELNSGELPFEVLPLPPNPPESFRGAVGQYQLIFAGMSPAQPRSGEPLYLEFIATGKGNLAQLPAPVALNAQNWQIESITTPAKPVGAQRLRGRTPEERKFTLLLRPSPGANPTRLPNFTLSYFDPESAQYLSSEVTPPALPPGTQFSSSSASGQASNDSNLSTPSLSNSRGSVFDEAGESSRPPADIVVAPLPLNPGRALPWRRPAIWIDRAGAALVLLIGLAGLAHHHLYNENRHKLRRLLAPLRKARSCHEASEALRCFIRAAAIPHPLPEELATCRKELEALAYQGGSLRDTPLSRERRKQLIQAAQQSVVKAKAKPRHSLAHSKVLLPLLLLLLGTIPQPSPAAQLSELESDAGWQALLADDPASAREHWLKLGEKQGFSANLCTHLGDASYRLDQGPQAMLWYRRALMLDPWQPEARHNIALVEGGLPDVGTAQPLLNELGMLYRLRAPFRWTARVSWWLAAGLALVPFAFKLRHSRRWWVGAAAAVVIALTGIVLEGLWRGVGEPEERFTILKPGQLLSAPVRASSPLMQLQPGETCRILAARGAWNYVETERRGNLPLRGWLHSSTGEELWPPSRSD